MAFNAVTSMLQHSMHVPTRQTKDNWANDKIKSNDGDLKATLYSVLLSRQSPNEMIKELTEMVEHSAAFRKYLGIASFSYVLQKLASFRKLEVAPVVLAWVSTLEIKESRAERALSELAKLLNQRELMLSQPAGEGIFILAKNLVDNASSTRLVVRAATIIANSLNILLERDKSKVLNVCSRISESSSAELENLRKLSQEFVKKEKSDRAAHSDRGGRNRLMNSLPEKSTN